MKRNKPYTEMSNQTAYGKGEKVTYNGKDAVITGVHAGARGTTYHLQYEGFDGKPTAVKFVDSRNINS